MSRDVPRPGGLLDFARLLMQIPDLAAFEVHVRTVEDDPTDPSIDDSGDTPNPIAAFLFQQYYAADQDGDYESMSYISLSIDRYNELKQEQIDAQG